MAEPFDLSKPNRTIRAGVILLDAETEVLDVAPIDLFSGLSKKFSEGLAPFYPGDIGSQALDVEFHWVNETGKTARLTGGIQLVPTDTFADCPPLDVVIMGAHVMNDGYNPSQAELDFIRKSYDDCSAFITICGGFLAPFQAGLFKGKTVTAPRLMLDQLRQSAPDTTWVEERWHRDGKLWTSGALLNGLDLMRAFGTEYWGGEGSYAQWGIELGHYPIRDVGYADAPSRF